MTLDAAAIQSKFLEGWALHQKGQTAEARRIYAEVIALDAGHFNALQMAGVVAAAAGEFLEAVNLITRAVAVKPKNAGAHYNLGLALGHLGRHQEALTSYDRSIALKPDYAEPHLSRGNALRELAQLNAALESYDKAIALKPGLAEAHNNRGNVLRDLNRFEDALSSFETALAINPHVADVHYNRANVLRNLKRDEEARLSFERVLALVSERTDAQGIRAGALYGLERYREALAACDKAIASDPASVEAHNLRGGILLALKQPEAALASYENAIAVNPVSAKSHANRGTALRELKRYEEALASYDAALKLDPTHADVHNNRGMILMELERPESALEAFSKAAQARPDADAHYSKASAYIELKAHAAAIESYKHALAIDPSFPYLYGNLLHTRMHICDWDGLDASLALLAEKIEQGEHCVTPFSALVLSDHAGHHLAVAKRWAKEKHPSLDELGALAPRTRKGKIRVGYFSMDFYNHPVALLMAELIEKHDRQRFEIIGFSFGPNTGDDWRKRLEKGFDKFVDVRNFSHREAAACARSEEIDIAVDLGGYTRGSRTDIFAMRAAPIQVNYLGYPGTLGAPYIDYIVGDGTVIPPEHRSYYVEKVVQMPDSFQVNARKRQIADKVFSRADLGLPEKGFVFCCFNNTYKITPATFNVWMQILQGVTGSVLLLYADNETAAANLRKEAAVRGVNAARLVFGDRLPMPEYLARYRAADLFLDTLPYNAGTTASDALWAGLPVLTRAGGNFAGRMAASLLHALGLDELITSTAEEYRDLAVALAHDPSRLAALKDKLERNRAAASLFDPACFARNIEQAFEQMIVRHDAGLPPDHIVVQR